MKQNRIAYKGLVVDVEQKKLFVDEKAVLLTRKEFEILHLLLQHIDHVFTREEILTRVWVSGEPVMNRTVDVNINRIRQKIGGYSGCLVTRKGFGYCFEDEGS